jgi:hypothetical protein
MIRGRASVSDTLSGGAARGAELPRLEPVRLFEESKRIGGEPRMTKEADVCRYVSPVSINTGYGTLP